MKKKREKKRKLARKGVLLDTTHTARVGLSVRGKELSSDPVYFVKAGMLNCESFGRGQVWHA